MCGCKLFARFGHPRKKKKKKISACVEFLSDSTSRCHLPTFMESLTGTHKTAARLSSSSSSAWVCSYSISCLAVQLSCDLSVWPNNVDWGALEIFLILWLFLAAFSIDSHQKRCASTRYEFILTFSTLPWAQYWAEKVNFVAKQHLLKAFCTVCLSIRYIIGGYFLPCVHLIFKLYVPYYMCVNVSFCR